jgi:NADH:ubiquinone oxidoreductase subunit E
MTHEIKICMGSACFAKGNQENLEYIKEFIETNGLDAKIQITGSLCENKCSVGPRIYIDDVEHIQVTRAELIKLLEELK